MSSILKYGNTMHKEDNYLSLIDFIEIAHIYYYFS